MFDDLQKAPTRRSLEGKLIKAPKGLTNLYALIIKRFSETLDEDQFLLCRRILQWIVTTRRHLTVGELAVALTVQEGQKVFAEADVMFDPQEEIMSLCAPLVEIVDDTVRIIHLSVKDFLFDPSRIDGQDDFSFSKDSLNGQVGISLLTLLSFDEFSAARTFVGSDDQIENQDQSFDTHSATSVSSQADNHSDDENEGSKASLLRQYGLDNWYHHCMESEVSENAHRLYKLVCNYLDSDNSFLWMRNLSVYSGNIQDWIHTESELLEWGGKLNVGNETVLGRGFIHRLADRRMTYLMKNLGSSDPETVSAMEDLADSWQAQEQWKEAEKLQVQVIDFIKNGPEQEDPEILRRMGKLALIYDYQGRYDEAEELRSQTLEKSKRMHGLEHPSTLTHMHNLACIYIEKGQWKKAEKLLIQVLEIGRRLLGQEHLSVIVSQSRLAMVYSEQGHWKEAEELQIQVLEIRKRDLGQRHPDTLMSMSYLALVYYKQERWKEAEVLQIQALEMRKRVFGQEYSHTLTSMSSLALTYSKQERWEEAEELQVQAIKISRRVIGQEHPHTLRIMSNLACTWKSLGRAKEAIALMRQVESGQRKVLGVEHHEVKDSRDWLEYWETELIQAPVV